MDKIVRPGTGKTYGGRGYSIYCHIKITDNKLSITGVEGPLPSGNCLGACGQIDMHLAGAQDTITLAPGWDRATLKRFFEVWDRWHMNDIRAECEHQRALGWTYEGHHDPITYQGEACPTCGYKIGSAWLCEPLPNDVVAFLGSLPDTDRKPAWV